MSDFKLFGVNLSGAEFGAGGTRGVNYDYTYPTHAEIDYFASKDMSVIRLPFLLERVQPTMDGSLSASEVSYIDDVVSYANSKGMKVILDPHDFGYVNGSQIGSTALPNSAFANFWGQLAGHFASNSNVVFGLMNEPFDISATQWLGSVNAAISAIRAVGATSQQILVPGTNWDGASSWVSSGNAAIIGTGVVDPNHNFTFEVHQYLDSDGSGTHSDVVSTTIGVERLQAVTAWAEATGNKVFLGEFGVAPDQASLSALDNMLGYMAQHSAVWQGGTYWAAGPWWGSYMYSVEPSAGVDKPQMAVLGKYVITTSQDASFGSLAGIAIEALGSTSLSQVGQNYFLDPVGGTGGPELKVNGAAVTAGQFGSNWVILGAEAVSGGYDVAWKNTTTGLSNIWSTDTHGNHVVDLLAGASSTSSAL
ncbi:cellulase family glycosylhydrolase, partial [Bradyrhizobium sp. 76]|uniref:cellulase family glycosylhydrolase n=1 Tax=Bradyrhizobium sp. 76 TaxID=2782680 RepID=UPI001FFA17A0